MKLKTWEEIDLLVDTDPLELRDYAMAVTKILIKLNINSLEGSELAKRRTLARYTYTEEPG